MAMVKDYKFKIPLMGLVLFLSMALFSTTLMAQQTKVLFESGITVFPENIEEFQVSTHVKPNEIIHGNYYRYVQFHDVPTQDVQDKFKALGIEVISYIPHNTYLMSIPDVIGQQQWKSMGVRSIMKVGMDQKVDDLLWNLPYPAYTMEGNKLRITLVHYDDIPQSYVIDQLAQQGIPVVKTSEHYPIVHALIDPVQVGVMAMLPYVKYIEQMPPPAEKEDTGGRTLQRSNQINTEYHGGLKFDGEGVSLMVRDDGAVGPHVDYKNRLVDLTGNNLGGTHGDGVAGVMGGAGNIDPDIEGGASASTIFVAQYFADFLDTATINSFTNRGVVITNSSYSNGCNAGYTTITQTVDDQVENNPEMIHVFSAGNSNNNNCNYMGGAAGNQWGNITGGHKVGKNVMAVANLFADESLVGSSSRGPAHDGRIKPDIAAHGQGQLSTDPFNQYQSFGGTSAAAPSMAGNMGQLYQAYKSMNNGLNPPSALIKATVMNTAHDLGNVGPDFIYGFGRIHTLRAYELLEDGNYLDDNISQADTNVHTLTVPAGVKEMRVMVYWVDPPATPGVTKALINNLDMTLEDPSNVTHSPYVLDILPDANSLSAPATTGDDTLNNVEQIVLTNPAAGSYNLNIRGTEVPMGPQKYYIVYTYITESLKLSYPIGGEGFVPGQSERIHWDAMGNNGTFNLEASYNGGTTWTTIASNINGSTRLFNWTVPNVSTGDARVRIVRGTESSISDTAFSIIGLPGNISFQQVCPDSITFSWTAVSGADSYDAFVLGEKFMDSVGTTTGTQITVPITNGFEENWVAVRARSATGAVGKRSLGEQAPLAPLNCGTDLALNRVLNPDPTPIQECAVDSNLFISVELQSTGVDTMRDVPMFFIFNNATFNDTLAGPIAPGATFIYQFQQPLMLPGGTGTFNLTVGMSPMGDIYAANDTFETAFEIVQGNTLSVPFIENFDNFSLCPTTSNCGSTVCGLSNGWINAPNFSADDADWRVNDGGTPSFDTGPSGDFSPTGNGRYLYTEASAGCNDATNLLISPCIDLTNAPGAGLIFAYHMYDLTGNDMGELHLDVFDGSKWILDIIPPIVGDQGNQWNQVNVPLTAYEGKVVNFRWRGITGPGFRSDIALDGIGVCTAPVSDFTFANLGGSIYGFQNNSPNSGTYTWIFGDGNTSNQPNPTHTYTSNDTFDVMLITTGVCGGGADTSVQQIIVTGVAAPFAAFSISDKRVCVNEFVTFIDQSAGLGINAYNWNFGPNGSITSTTFQGPVRVRFSQRGVQTIRLVVTNSVGSDTITQNLLVVDEPVADFGIDPNGLDVQFTNNSLDGLEYTWRFGDGSVDTSATPIHTYQDSGVYVVTLIATNECGTDSISKSIAVPGIDANFAASVTLACVGEDVIFTDQSTGLGINGYSWNFGSAASVPSANTQGPHTVSFNQTGLQSVTLAVTNSNGEVDSFEVAVFVEEAPTAGFATQSDNGNFINFTTTSPNADSYFWDFGDGSTDTTANPGHGYLANGSYTVVQVVSNECGSDTTTQVITVSTVGIQNLEELGISVYPNPNEGVFTVSLENLSTEKVKLELTDLKGKKVYSTEWQPSIQGSNKVIEVSGLAKGVYMLQLQTGDKVGYTKLLIEK